MPSVRGTNRSKSERFLTTVAKYDRCLIVTHDNPDPDAIAAGWAILRLIKETLGLNVRLVGGGAIVRAENRHLVELLQPPIELIDDIQATADTATVLVDCSLGASNHLLTRCRIQPVAIIDHHPAETNGAVLPFKDIRTNVAASSSIAASYLRQQAVEPGAKLATAMLYAIRTDTCGCEFYFSRLDRDILPWLTERADPEMIAEIESAPLSRAYFGDLTLAIQNTFVYEDAAFCLLPRADGAEIVGEVADLLIRCQGIHRVFCGAVIDEDVLISVRTKTGSENAAKLLQRCLDGLGGGGGHAHRAGGKIAGGAKGTRVTEQLYEELRTRWLSACDVEQTRGTRLVAKHEILENL